MKILEKIKKVSHNRIDELYNKLIEKSKDTSDSYAEFIELILDKDSELGEALRSCGLQLNQSAVFVSNNSMYPDYDIFEHLLFFIYQIEKGDACFDIRNNTLYGSTLWDYLKIDLKNNNFVSITSVKDMIEFAKKYMVCIKKRNEFFNLSVFDDRKKQLKKELTQDPITIVKRQYLVEEIFEMPLKENETPDIFLNGFWPKNPKICVKTYFPLKIISEKEENYYKKIQASKLGRLVSPEEKNTLNIFNARNKEFEETDSAFQELISYCDPKKKITNLINLFLSEEKNEIELKKALYNCVNAIGWSDVYSLKSLGSFICNCFLDDTYWNLNIRRLDAYGSMWDYFQEKLKINFTQDVNTFINSAKELARRTQKIDEEQDMHEILPFDCFDKKEMTDKHIILTETKEYVYSIPLLDNENPLDFINCYNPFKKEIKSKQEIKVISDDEYLNTFF